MEGGVGWVDGLDSSIVRSETALRGVKIVCLEENASIFLDASATDVELSGAEVIIDDVVDEVKLEDG